MKCVRSATQEKEYLVRVLRVTFCIALLDQLHASPASQADHTPVLPGLDKDTMGNGSLQTSFSKLALRRTPRMARASAFARGRHHLPGPVEIVRVSVGGQEVREMLLLEQTTDEPSTSPRRLCPDRARRLVRLLLRQPVEVGAGERRGRRGEGDAAADGAAVVHCFCVQTLLTCCRKCFAVIVTSTVLAGRGASSHQPGASSHQPGSMWQAVRAPLETRISLAAQGYAQAAAAGDAFFFYALYSASAPNHLVW